MPNGFCIMLSHNVWRWQHNLYSQEKCFKRSNEFIELCVANSELEAADERRAAVPHAAAQRRAPEGKVAANFMRQVNELFSTKFKTKATKMCRSFVQSRKRDLQSTHSSFEMLWFQVSHLVPNARQWHSGNPTGHNRRPAGRGKAPHVWHHQHSRSNAVCRAQAEKHLLVARSQQAQLLPANAEEARRSPSAVRGSAGSRS